MLQEKEKQDRLEEDNDGAVATEDQQLIPASSCSSSEGDAMDKPPPAKKGTCILCACVTNLHKLVSFLSVVRKEVPFRVKRNFDILRGRFATMFVRTYAIMQNCSLREMKDYLFAGFREMRSEIEPVNSMDELKSILLKRCSFTDYTILEDLADHLQLADAQKLLSDYTKFRDWMYGKILAEDFPVAAIDERMKDHETKVCLHCESILTKSLSWRNFGINRRLSLRWK